MSALKDNINKAYQWAFTHKPKANGFPYLAAALKHAGVDRYVYNLPSCQCIYFSKIGNVVVQSEVLLKGMSDVPKFDKDEFIKFLRVSQSGESTFPEFLQECWDSGIISYEADLVNRKVSYYGVLGESYVENYPEVEINI